MKRTLIVLGTSLSVVLSVALAGCAAKKAEVEGDRLTVGKVQGEIRVGLDAAKVAEILGSPNIVTTDDKRREVWIYDKISTDISHSEDSGGGGLILVFGYGKSAGSKSTNQRTLTVIIKFDEQKKVRDFAYNYTQF